ncbi:MAG: hypothetical protein H0U62_12435, partial [Actinobacteria bacterium]|nr:hypothetical protein [Actinomycetota bacterium]
AGSLLRTALFGLGVPTVVAGVETLGGALAALIGGLIGVVGAAGPAVGGLAALLPILLSVAGAVGTVMLAFRGVGDALKAGGAADKAAGASAEASAKRRAAAAKQVEEAQYSLGQAVKAQARVQEAAARDVEAANERLVDASRGVEAANERLVDANNAVVRAEQDLHDARRQAIRDLQELSEQVSDNALSVEGAEIALLRAQERQQKVNADATASALDRREAAHAVASAEDRLSDARRRSTQDQAALNEAEARGVDGAPGVVAAQESIAAAQKSVADAQESVASAERDRSKASRELDRAVRDGALAQQDAAEQVSRAQARLADAIAATAAASDSGSAAASKYADAMANLSPAGRDLVNLLRSLQPLIQELSHAAQEALFPGLISALKILAPMIRTVAIPSVKALGAALGTLAVDGANRLKSFESELLAFGTGDGPDLVGQLGRSFLNLAEILGVLTFAAVPLAKWLAGLVELWTANTLGTLRTAKETGRLALYFDRVKTTLKLLGNILKNVGSILFSMFKAAAPMGRRLLESFRDLTKQTADFLKTGEGKNKLKEYFDALEPNIRLTLKLLGDITMAFAKMGASKGATAVLTAMDRELGPSLGRLASALSKLTEAMGPRLVTLFADLADALANIINAGGGDFFAAFVMVLAVFATVLREITEIPGIAKLAGWLLAIAGALKAIKLVGKITGLSAAAGGLSRMAGGAAAARAGETPAVGTKPATTFMQGAKRGATGQPTSGQPTTLAARGGASGAPSMMARGGAVVGRTVAAPVRRLRGQPPLSPVGGRGGPGTTAAPAGFAGYPPTTRQRAGGAGGAVRRVGSAVGGTGAMVAGAVGGSMAGAAIGQRVGGDTGAMVGSLAGSVAGAAAPQALVSAFSALGPLVDGAKTKLASMASTLSGAVAGAARASGAALMSAVSGAGRAVGALAGVAGAWLRTAAAAVLSGARQAAAWLLARGTAAAGLIASLAQAAVGYARLAVAALASAAKQVAVAVAMGVVRGAVMAWTAAQWLLNLAMNANPIG